MILNICEFEDLLSLKWNVSMTNIHFSVSIRRRDFYLRSRTAWLTKNLSDVFRSNRIVWETVENQCLLFSRLDRPSKKRQKSNFEKWDWFEKKRWERLKTTVIDRNRFDHFLLLLKERQVIDESFTQKKIFSLSDFVCSGGWTWPIFSSKLCKEEQHRQYSSFS